MKNIFLSTFIIFLNSVIIAQVLSVKDIVSNEVLEFVTIRSDNPKAITVTNSSGQANISLYNNSNEITFQLLGYKTIIKSFKEIEKNSFILFLTPSSISLDQIIISATKWSQSNKEIPSRIAIITPKDIVFHNPQTAADLLTISGEVYVQKSQQGGGSPMLRGFATNRVLISVDGIRMNNAIFRSGNIQNVISIDPFSIENTEVLFGPGSILYGSDAIGGSMNFYTLRPQFTFTTTTLIRGHAQYRHSSANNENTGHFDINIGWRNFAMLTSFSFNSFGDLTMGSNGPEEYLRNEYVETANGIDKIKENSDSKVQKPTGYSQLNLMQKFRYSPNEDWYFDYGFHYSSSSKFDRYDRLLRYDDNHPKSAEWHYGPQKWMMNSLTITNLHSNSFYDDLAIRGAYQYFEESRNDRDFNGSELRKRNEQVYAYSINLDFSKSLDLSNQFNYGLEAIYNNVKSDGINEDVITEVSTQGPSRYPQATWLSTAGYFVYQHDLSKSLLFQTGLRYNYYHLMADFDTTFYSLPFTSSKISNGAITGSIGLVYNPTKTLTIGLNLSTGFRSPNVDDIGKVFDSEPGSVVIPNPNLKAEYAYNAEFSIAKLFNDFLKLDVSCYYTILDDAMVRRNSTLNGLDSIFYDGELSQVQAIQNAASAYVWGLQAGFDLDLYENLILSSNINYQKGEEELDSGEKSPLRHAAPIFGRTSLTYKYGKMNAHLSFNYNSEISNNNLASEEKSKFYIYAIDENGNPYSPSWYSLNIKLSYNIMSQFFITAAIENITDQRYKQYSSGIAAPGRNFVFSARMSF